MFTITKNTCMFYINKKNLKSTIYGQDIHFPSYINLVRIVMPCRWLLFVHLPMAGVCTTT